MKSTIKRTEISRSIRSILVGSGAALALSAGGTVLAADAADLETPPSLTGSGDIDALKEQVQTLMDRIDQLEQQQASSDQQVSELKEQADTVPANVVTAGTLPGSIKIPGSDTSISVGGYVKGDLIYDLDADVGDSFSLSAVPADGTPDQDNVRLHAKQSRLVVGSQTELGNGGNISTTVEGDFFGAGGNQLFSNSTALRLRQAVATWDTGTGSAFTAGQTWTTFGGFEYAPTVDFFAPNGQVFARQGLLRWTTGGFAVAVENPESVILDSVGKYSGGEDDGLPDLVARWSGGGYNISGIVREINGFGTGVDGVAYDDDTIGWGIHAGGSWSMDPVTLHLGVTYGDGLGRYILAHTSGIDAVAVGGEDRRAPRRHGGPVDRHLRCLVGQLQRRLLEAGRQRRSDQLERFGAKRGRLHPSRQLHVEPLAGQQPRHRGDPRRPGAV